MATQDPLALRVLAYLANQYRPVMADWVDMAEIAAGLAVSEAEVEARCQLLLQRGFIEAAPPDEENESPAALITVKGLLAIGRVP